MKIQFYYYNKMLTGQNIILTGPQRPLGRPVRHWCMSEDLLDSALRSSWSAPGLSIYILRTW